MHSMSGAHTQIIRLNVFRLVVIRSRYLQTNYYGYGMFVQDHLQNKRNI